MAPSGKSATTVTASPPARSLPAITPPALRKSLSLIADSLPMPTTIRREALRPWGARISSTAPLLPLNRLAVATRPTRSAASPNALRAAAPNFNWSSQNTTRMPREAVENGTKPTLTASDMGKSSKNQGCDRAGKPGRCSLWRGCTSVKSIFQDNFQDNFQDYFQDYFPHTMACPGAQSQARPWPEGHIT